MAASLKLYVKRTCPWCVMAQDWLDSHGYKYELVDVLARKSDYDAMLAFSGQRYTPTLLVDGEKLLADFGPEELEAFIQHHQIIP
jgi:glutaredoxin 3